MAQPTNDLIYEVLKKLQIDSAENKLGQHRILDHISAIEKHLGAMTASMFNYTHDLLDFKTRLDRIERRLELQDKKK